jgi:putative FmdB family regulatory protein
MPTYEYFCDKCDSQYDVIKLISEYIKAQGQDQCPKCGKIGTRIPSCNIEFTGTKIEDAEFNVGLGTITKSKRHREELAKQKGLIEVGSENPDNIHKIFDRQREETRKKGWDEVL